MYCLYLLHIRMPRKTADNSDSMFLCLRCGSWIIIIRAVYKPLHTYCLASNWAKLSREDIKWGFLESDLIICWNPRGPSNRNYKYVNFPIEKTAKPPGSMCVHICGSGAAWLTFQICFLRSNNKPGRYAIPTGCMGTWLVKINLGGDPSMVRLHQSPSNPWINNLNFHWIDAECGCQGQPFKLWHVFQESHNTTMQQQRTKAKTWQIAG